MHTPGHPAASTPPSSRAIETLIRSSQILARRREPFVQRALAFDHCSSLVDPQEYVQDPIGTLPTPQGMIARLDGQMARYEAVFWVWIRATFELLQSPLGGTICPHPNERANEVSLMWTAAARMVEAVPLFQALQDQLATFEELMECVQAEGAEATDGNVSQQGEFHRAFEAITQEIALTLSAAQRVLNNVTYPFESKPMASISGYVFEKAPREEQSPLASAYAFVERFPDLYARVIGRLCRIAEETERSIVGQPTVPMA